MKQLKCICGCSEEMKCIVDDRALSKYSSPALYFCEECKAVASIDKNGTIFWSRNEKPLTTTFDFNP